jgi:hypothetical protein
MDLRAAVQFFNSALLIYKTIKALNRFKLTGLSAQVSISAELL